MGKAISVNDAKSRYWRMQRQSDLALAVLKDLIRADVAAGRDPKDLAIELKLADQFIKDAVKEHPVGDEAFTFALPDGSYVRRWFSIDTDAMTWYCAQALDVGFDRELGPFMTREDAVAALG